MGGPPIPDLPELKLIAGKFYLWGFFWACNLINPDHLAEDLPKDYYDKSKNEILEVPIIKDFEEQWRNERQDTWGLPYETEDNYNKLRDLPKIPKLILKIEEKVINENYEDLLLDLSKIKEYMNIKNKKEE